VEILMAIVIGVMFASATYMILRPSLIRIAMGFGLYSNATNLLLIACGGYDADWESPFIRDGAGKLMDPLPPDIILTAIVISFAVGALMLAVSYRVYADYGTDDPEKLPQDPLL
jgi:multicomponent Na+:H+ antiporter subunit C